MSDRGAKRRWSTNAETIQARAGEWIARRDHSDWAVQDQSELDAWLAESPAHMVAFLRLSDIWQRANRLRALGGSPRGGIARLRFGKLFGRIAAGLIVMVLAGAGAAYYFTIPREVTYATPVGGHEAIALNDGSHIELNTDTVLHVQNSDRKQIVKLEKGEAYFQVKHNPSRKFVVLIGDHTVTDLGTKFLIRSEPNRLEIALTEGRAQFDTQGEPSRSVLLAPGDVLTMSGGVVTTSKKSAQTMAAELGWRRGTLVFDNVSLGDAVTEFNRYSAEKLVVADRAAAQIPVSATFPTNGVGDFIQLAQVVLGLRIERRDGEVVISR